MNKAMGSFIQNIHSRKNTTQLMRFKLETCYNKIFPITLTTTKKL